MIDSVKESNIKEIVGLLAEFFENDDTKIITWLNMRNYGLGDISPASLIKVGRSKKVLQFIKAAKDESWGYSRSEEEGE
jgi:hypothetical protein